MQSPYDRYDHHDWQPSPQHMNRLTRHNRAMAQLVTAVQELSLTHDLDAVMAVVRRAARALSGADGATFVLREGDQCYYAEEDAIGPLWKDRHFPMEACISGWVMMHRRPAVIEDIYTDPRIPIEAYRPTFVKSLAMVPIRTASPIGAIGTYWADRYLPTAEDLTVLQALADTTAVALENVQLYAMLEQRVQDRTRSLQQTNKELAREIAERQRAEEALREAHDALERRVQERTAELATTNDALRREIAERRQAEGALQRAERLALLGKLAAGMSHELRNPLNTIFLHTDILEEEVGQLVPASQDGVAESVAAIKAEVGRLQELVQDYLSLARLASLHRRPDDLGAFVQACAREMEASLMPQGITLHLEALASLGQVAFHPNTLRRALFNLIQNAREAMPQGGTLTIRGRHDGAQAQLDVSDTGTGIPGEHMQDVFEPLHTTKPEGTGLGLYIVREIIVAHAGHIAVQSKPGHGTTFTITLPGHTAEKSPQA